MPEDTKTREAHAELSPKPEPDDELYMFLVGDMQLQVVASPKAIAGVLKELATEGALAVKAAQSLEQLPRDASLPPAPAAGT